MKVCFWGNQGNVSYRYCKWLHLKGWDAHLYMMENDNIRSFPELIDRDLKRGSYPDWIHVYRNSALRTLFIDSKVKKHIEENYDIIVISGAFAMISGRDFSIPMINISTGPSNQGVIKMWDNLSFCNRIKWWVARPLIRKTVRKCKRVLVHYDPELYSLAKINQDGKIIFFGSSEDVLGNQERVDKKHLDELNAKYSGYERVFLWLGRVSFSDILSPMYKGTDKFVEAAEYLIKEGKKIKLVIGEHGEDVDLLKNMVAEKGLLEHVEWVPHMEYWKLLTYMSISNAVVVDELTEYNCVSSGMFRECLSVGGVLIRSYSPILTKAGHGPDCPVLHAVTADDVRDQMLKVINWSQDDWSEHRRKTLAWAEKYLNWDHQIDRFCNIIEQVVYIDKVSKRLGKFYS